MGHCGQEGCKGHFGKFPNCTTEALWEVSMIAGDSTGSVDAYGHYTLIHFEADDRHVMGEDLGVEDHGPVVVIPAGWYIVITNDQGAVDSAYYETESEAMEIFTAVDQDYSAWLEINEPDEWDIAKYSDIAPNAGSSE